MAGDPGPQSSLSEYSVRPGGRLTVVPGTPRQRGAASFTPGSVLYSPRGGRLAVTSDWHNAVWMYAVDPRGRLRKVGSLYLRGFGPRDAAFSPDGRFLAVSVGKSVELISVAGDGRLAQATPMPKLPLDDETDTVAFSPSGRFLVAGEQSGRLYAFAVAATGALSRVAQRPVSTHGSEPRSLAFSPGGRFLAVGDYASSTVAMLSMSSAGTLAGVPGSPFRSGAGGSPDAVSFSPDGRLLAVANSNGSDVSVFSVARSGRLGSHEKLRSFTPRPGGYPSLGPADAVFSPDGRLLAVANYGDGTVSLFERRHA